MRPFWCPVAVVVSYLSMMWPLCSASGEPVAVRNASFLIDRFLTFCSYNKQEERFKSGSHGNFDDVVAFEQNSVERCLLQ